MAVKGPLRAVLAAHLQASFNRASREMRRSTSAKVITILGIVAASLGILPMVFGIGVAGFFTARVIETPATALVLGAVLTLVPVVIGLGEGIFSGGHQLSWESYRIFPLRLRTLFAAEILAGVGSIGFMLAGLAALAFWGTACFGKPAYAPLFLACWLGGGLLHILTVHLAGGVAAGAMKRLRFVLLLLLVCASMMPMIAQGSRPRFSRRPEIQETHEEREARRARKQAKNAAEEAAFKAKVTALAPVLAPLPGVQALQGGLALRQGHLATGLLRLAYPFGFLILLGMAVARILAWESRPGALRKAASPRGPERLWSFDTPAAGIARLTLASLLKSYLGRMALLTPAFALVLIRYFGRGQAADQWWAFPTMVLYVVLGLQTVMYNQFGLDGQGIKALFLLPLKGEDLLKGKAMALGLFAGGLSLATLLLQLVVAKPQPLDVPAALLLGLSCFLIQTSLGHWTSAWMPRALAWDTLKGNQLPTAVVFISLGATAAAAGLLGGFYALLRFFAGPWWTILGMGLVAAALGAAYVKLALPPLGAYLDRHRERVLNALQRG